MVFRTILQREPVIVLIVQRATFCIASSLLQFELGISALHAGPT